MYVYVSELYRVFARSNVTFQSSVRFSKISNMILSILSNVLSKSFLRWYVTPTLTTFAINVLCMNDCVKLRTLVLARKKNRTPSSWHPGTRDPLLERMLVIHVYVLKAYVMMSLEQNKRAQQQKSKGRTSSSWFNTLCWGLSKKKPSDVWRHDDFWCWDDVWQEKRERERERERVREREAEDGVWRGLATSIHTHTHTTTTEPTAHTKTKQHREREKRLHHHVNHLYLTHNSTWRALQDFFLNIFWKREGERAWV